MKYKCAIEIELPLTVVVNLWQDESLYNEWQEGFVKIERVKGAPGTVGAQAKIYLKHGKPSMELLVTIIVKNLPDERVALYEHKHMTNKLTSRFQSIGDKVTRYSTEVEYTKFNGLLPRIMAAIFPGMFKKQSQKWLDSFKNFVERHARDTA